jgi:hypothetical protein
LGFWWKYEYSKRQALAGAGTQTAALAFGGNTPAITAATENMMEQIGQQSNPMEHSKIVIYQVLVHKLQL